MTRHILVSGATGFVGHPLCFALAQAGFRVRALCRELSREFAAPEIDARSCGDIASITQWRPILEGIDTVIHLAGRAHVMHAPTIDAAQLYTHHNVDVTVAIARGAITSGVRRFIFLSSIKVFGDGPFTEPLAASQAPTPDDDYGCSKLQAEQELRALGRQTPLEIAIVRPPLVYGPGVRANFLRLLRWVECGVPLPLSRVHNRRSLISRYNLNEFLVGLVARPEPCSGTWHVADGEDCSTAELVRALARHMGRPARLFACPAGLLRLGFTLAGRSRDYARLCGSLQVDVRETRQELGWYPTLSLDDGLARTVAWYQGMQHDT